jgi:hypothetical protein
VQGLRRFSVVHEWKVTVQIEMQGLRRFSIVHAWETKIDVQALRRLSVVHACETNRYAWTTAVQRCAHMMKFASDNSESQIMTWFDSLISNL